MRESDDDDVDVNAKEAAKKPIPAPKVNGVTVSPKPAKAKEPINLVEANVLANQKKKLITNPSPKVAETELEKALAEVVLSILNC